MKCALCGEEIEVQPFTGWNKGNNGQPLVDGRVCDLCDMKVIEHRMKLALEERKQRLNSEEVKNL